MSGDAAKLLNALSIRVALRTAWLDSNPGIVGGHEEGGFILRDSAGILSVVRWPRGETNSIFLPSHAGCKIGDCEIIASFHTHPNTGLDYLQEPSETDKRAVRDDPDLKGAFYVGELVISNERIYQIAQDGRVTEIAETTRLFDDSERA
jgi:hypothetical protein